MKFTTTSSPREFMNPARSNSQGDPNCPSDQFCSDDSAFHPVTWIEDNMHLLCDAESLIAKLLTLTRNDVLGQQSQPGSMSP